MTLFTVLLACSGQPEVAEPNTPAPTPEEPEMALRAGTWRAWLESPGGELPFKLEVADLNGTWKAWIGNAAERLAVDEVRVEGEEIVFDIAHYDANIRATWSENGKEMQGTWWKQKSQERVDTLPFHATLGYPGRFPRADDPSTNLSGRWRVDFDGDEFPAISLFEHTGTSPDITGTFLTALGDYRYIDGSLQGDDLRLSTFDGAHAFLFHGKTQPDGTLKGDFWSGGTWHQTWTATRDEDVRLPDAMTLTKVEQHPDWAALSFPDVDGVQRKLADPAFAGKARIIQVMGTWCPNCNDETAFLTELHRDYSQLGLSIVSLAFEHSGDFDRDARMVRRYAAFHDAQWPFLVAGVSNKGKAGEKLPILERIVAYPTAIFVDSTGKVRAVHTGFTGPVLPVEHAALKAEFTRIVAELLAE